MANLKTIRTDVVGSLLRPRPARKRASASTRASSTPRRLRALEDEAVRDAVRLQESVGLDVISDGEMRRLNFQDSFGAVGRGLRRRAARPCKRTSSASRAAAPLRRWDIPDLHDRPARRFRIAAR